MGTLILVAAVVICLLLVIVFIMNSVQLAAAREKEPTTPTEFLRKVNMWMAIAVGVVLAILAAILFFHSRKGASRPQFRSAAPAADSPADAPADAPADVPSPSPDPSPK